MRAASTSEPGHAPRGMCELGDQSNPLQSGHSPASGRVRSLTSLPWLGRGTYANLLHEGREWEGWCSFQRQLLGLRELVHAGTFVSAPARLLSWLLNPLRRLERLLSSRIG